MIHRETLVAAYAALVNSGYALLVIWLLQRRRPGVSWAVLLACLWAGVMSILFALELVQPPALKTFMRHYLYLPIAVEMVWNLLVLPILLPLTILIVLVIRRLRSAPARAAAGASEPAGGGLSRREFLYLVGWGAMPAVAVASGVHGTLTRNDLRLRRFDLPIAGLPPELNGLTIAHVSDLHSGLFVGPRRLREVTDLANDTKADIVVVTGDLINRAMDEFPAALAAVRRLESRHGLFLCEGNHDIFPGDGIVVEACRRHGLDMLWNSAATLELGGRRVILAGLPWFDPPPGTDPAIVARLFPPRAAEGDLRILLAHHPHIFDFASSADLVLSGHTHGGQIMFGDVGLGSLRFKYNSGRFQRGATTMIVNNGCGDWFPCRIGAPAEIGLLRLTRAA
ncbi:MAG: metallophosphoesterase [Verrucomicrobiota bacterium]